MKDTKLIQILKTFTKEEIKEFEKFVASPYFSRGRNLKPLFKILRTSHPHFNNPIFTYESIFKSLYPEEKNNKLRAENVLRVLSSELVKLAEEFLTYEQMKSNKLRMRNILLEVYINKKLNKQFVKLYSETQNDLARLMDGAKTKHFSDLYILKMMEVIYKFLLVE